MLIVFSFWYIYEGKNYHLDNNVRFVVFSVSFTIGSVLFFVAVCGLAGVLGEKVILAKLVCSVSIAFSLFQFTQPQTLD